MFERGFLIKLIPDYLPQEKGNNRGNAEGIRYYVHISIEIFILYKMIYNYCSKLCKIFTNITPQNETFFLFSFNFFFAAKL